MTDEAESSHDRAKEEYRRLINAYGDALTAKDPIAAELFAQATAAWERLRELNGDEAKLDYESHLVLALSFAVGAGDPVEAKRIYDAMSEGYRETADGVDALKPEPGSMKIWLRKQVRQ